MATKFQPNTVFAADLRFNPRPPGGRGRGRKRSWKGGGDHDNAVTPRGLRRSTVMLWFYLGSPNPRNDTEISPKPTEGRTPCTARFFCPSDHAAVARLFFSSVSQICPFITPPHELSKSQLLMLVNNLLTGASVSGFLPTTSWAVNTAVKLISLQHGWSHHRLAKKTSGDHQPRFRTLSTALSRSCVHTDRQRAQPPPCPPPPPHTGNKQAPFSRIG